MSGVQTVIIERGMHVIFKPEWRDPNDDKYTFVAVTDVHPIDGGFDVSTIENTLWIRGVQRVRAHMVESATPLLPVATFLFLGLDKKGARVQMRRMVGDRELSVTVETLPRSTLYQLFRRRAADCKAGDVLRVGIEFPEHITKGAAL